jgi:hypothetical protein
MSDKLLIEVESAEVGWISLALDIFRAEEAEYEVERLRRRWHAIYEAFHTLPPGVLGITKGTGNA